MAKEHTSSFQATCTMDHGSRTSGVVMGLTNGKMDLAMKACGENQKWRDRESSVLQMGHLWRGNSKMMNIKSDHVILNFKLLNRYLSANISKF